MNILLFIVSIIHLINDLFLSIYIFIFNKKYDIYFIIYIFIISIHWMFFKNECILSYIEKKLINKNYKLGQNPNNLPYRKNFPKILIKIFDILKPINILYVCYRNTDNKYILTLIFITVIFATYGYSYNRYIKTD